MRVNLAPTMRGQKLGAVSLDVGSQADVDALSAFGKEVADAAWDAALKSAAKPFDLPVPKLDAASKDATAYFETAEDARAFLSFLDGVKTALSGRQRASVPVALRDAESNTVRTVHVASQAEAEALGDYLRMSMLRAQASVDPITKIEITNEVKMPTRRTESTVKYAPNGEIEKVVQMERSV